VKLTGGPLKSQFDRIHASYLAVSEDGLLKEFRLRAGLPANGWAAGTTATALRPGIALAR
jgi:hypothetical protein